MDRRHFLIALMSLGLATAMPCRTVLAKDGGDDGDSDSGDDDDSGGSSGSSDDSDDSGNDDSGDDKGGNDDRSGSSGGSGRDAEDESDDDSSGSSGKERDHKQAREAVERGEILPLREILKRVDELGGGRVIAVDLDMRARQPFYTLKVQSGSSVKTLKLEAATGRKLNFFGW